MNLNTMCFLLHVWSSLCLSLFSKKNDKNEFDQTLVSLHPVDHTEVIINCQPMVGGDDWTTLSVK